MGDFREYMTSDQMPKPPLKGNKTWIVTVKPVVRYDEMAKDDQNFFGQVADYLEEYRFEIFAPDEEKALDWFHTSVPIAMLEDFEVEVQS